MTNNTTSSKRLFADEDLKRSPFYPRLEELNVREAWEQWNGYKFADHFYDPEYEYFCIRNQCGTYDITGMQKYLIEGPDAEAMLNRMVTRDMRKLKVNRVTYLCWCTDEGRMIDDGTVFRLGEEKFMLTCGSPSNAWLKMSAVGFDNCTITDITDETAALAFQGPVTCEVLKRMGLEGIENLKRFGIMTFPFEGSELIVSRTGFTGDLGYELWTKAELGLKLWDTLYAAGEDYGIQPVGEAAINMARLEAGLIMPYLDFTEALKTVHFKHDQSPLMLNIEFVVDFKKPHFNGRQALIEEKERGPEYLLVKLDIEGNKDAEGAILYSEESCKQEIGYITSTMWSPVVKSNIALAMVKTSALKGEIWAEIYFYKELRPYRKMAICEVRDKPFYMPKHASATPPPPFGPEPIKM